MFHQPAELVALFEQLARDWKGWEGKREWSSIEGELTLAFSSDNTGHIHVDVVVRNSEIDRDWSLVLKPLLLIPAGELDQIAKRARAVFLPTQATA